MCLKIRNGISRSLQIIFPWSSALLELGSLWLKVFLFCRVNSKIFRLLNLHFTLFILGFCYTHIVYTLHSSSSCRSFRRYLWYRIGCYFHDNRCSWSWRTRSCHDDRSTCSTGHDRYRFCQTPHRRQLGGKRERRTCLDVESLIILPSRTYDSSTRPEQQPTVCR